MKTTIEDKKLTRQTIAERKEANIAILGDRPSACRPEYPKRFGEEALTQMRTWHALPDNWWTVSYEEFLAARRPLIAEGIRASFRKLT